MHAGLRSRAAGMEVVAETPRSTDVHSPVAMDEDAFRALYDRTARPLFAYVLRVSGSSDVADDLLQESYCRLLSAKLPVMDETQMKSYLFRIATNLLRDRWRVKERAIEKDAPEPSSPARDPAVHTDVQRALQQLAPRQRQLLWLAYVEGASHKEIAQVTGLRAGSIRMLLFRARRRLVERLEPNSQRTKTKVTV